MQYVLCKFRDTDTRTYTYHNEGELFSVGGVVRVADARGDGWKPVIVCGLSDETPSFATKSVFGIHAFEPLVKEPTELDLEGDAA